MIWLSPAYPVGGFSYSHGLEWTVEAGKVRDAATLGDWIEDILKHGAGRSDAILLAEHGAGGRWRRAPLGRYRGAGRGVRTLGRAAPGDACAGRGVPNATRAVWPSPMLERLAAVAARPCLSGRCRCLRRRPWLAAGAHSPGLRPGLRRQPVSAGVRLIPLGQTDGLRVLARLEPPIPPPSTGSALGASLDDIGGAAVMADIASMWHETQYTRLFRS